MTETKQDSYLNIIELINLLHNLPFPRRRMHQPVEKLEIVDTKG
jgi:hypothetical protein